MLPVLPILRALRRFLPHDFGPAGLFPLHLVTQPCHWTKKNAPSELRACKFFLKMGRPCVSIVSPSLPNSLLQGGVFWSQQQITTDNGLPTKFFPLAFVRGRALHDSPSLRRDDGGDGRMLIFLWRRKLGGSISRNLPPAFRGQDVKNERVPARLCSLSVPLRCFVWHLSCTL